MRCKKYEKIYEDIKTLQLEDTLQLVLETETEEQRSFYEMVGDFLLQKKQWQVIERILVWGSFLYVFYSKVMV